MWRLGKGFSNSTKILLKVDLNTGEILVNHLDEFWAESNYVTSTRAMTWDKMDTDSGSFGANI
ncbi:MAG: hypothetical protein ACOYEO_07715 [bacterium]